MTGLFKNDPETREGKYPIILRRDGSVVDRPNFVLLASDPAAVLALIVYANQCRIHGYDPEYVEEVRQLADDFETWREENRLDTHDVDRPNDREDDPAILAWARSVGCPGT